MARQSYGHVSSWVLPLGMTTRVARVTEAAGAVWVLATTPPELLWLAVPRKAAHCADLGSVEDYCNSSPPAAAVMPRGIRPH
eukprot:COSAG03_NODE_714_length_6148_cov_12.953050_8_plen_82_part_00